MPLDLYRLEQLIAVAEEGSVTKAAVRLHLSQQALSTSMRNLEREVGVTLLERGGNRVQLSPAGEALVADARALRGLAGTALRRARRIGRGEFEVLRVGHTPAVTGEEVGELLRTVRAAQPELRIEPHLRYPADMHRQLLDGDLDLGLCRAMSPAQGLARTSLTRHRLSVAVDEHHRLAGRAGVTIEELAGETIVVWGQPGSSGYTDLLLALCRQAGFEPRTTRSDMQGVPPPMTVVGTRHVAFVTAAPGTIADGVRVITLTPPAHVPLIALWLDHTTSETRDAFVRTVRQTADEHTGM